MGAYTIPLKRVIELTGGSTELVDGVTKLTSGNIGLAYYPIFDETYRDHLTGVIVDHYWNREIGQETIDMFQLAMRRKMNEIMPVYNQMYLSTKVEYDPLSTIDLKTVTSGSNTQGVTSHGTNNTTTDNQSKSRSVTSETPQTMLEGSEDYATGAADVNSDTTATSDAIEDSTSNVNASSTGDSEVSGYQGVASELIMRYRDSLINVDIMVIAELDELFMGVWDTGDTYTNNTSFYPFYY